MRCLVLGAGAWGLPAAAELAARGHDVLLLDRYGVGNPWSSSPGPTRLWRLTHPDRARVRLMQRGVEAMERLARLTDSTVFLRRGLLWRDDVSLAAVAHALAAEDVPFDPVAADEVDRWFPGLRPDGRDAVWQPEAGPVLAAASLAAQARRFEDAGGKLRAGCVVREVDVRPAGVRIRCEDGARLDGDVAVLAAGPGAEPMLRSLGVDLPLAPVLQQVVHFGDPTRPGDTDDLACLFDGPHGQLPGMYTMPTPGVGYKVGLDRELRPWAEQDRDRTPDPVLVADTAARVRRTFGRLPARVVDAQVCSWTVSPDGRFVVDTLPGGVVLACGDSGEGFKFSAVMGLVLADLAEGRTPDADVATFGLARFADGFPDGPHPLGR